MAAARRQSAAYQAKYGCRKWRGGGSAAANSSRRGSAYQLSNKLSRIRGAILAHGGSALAWRRSAALGGASRITLMAAQNKLSAGGIGMALKAMSLSANQMAGWHARGAQLAVAGVSRLAKITASRLRRRHGGIEKRISAQNIGVGRGGTQWRISKKLASLSK